jgi:hypothetical protein
MSVPMLIGVAAVFMIVGVVATLLVLKMTGR